MTNFYGHPVEQVLHPAPNLGMGMKYIVGDDQNVDGGWKVEICLLCGISKGLPNRRT